MAQVINQLKNLLFIHKIKRRGAIAQLGERLPCTQEVGGSIPPSSTMTNKLLFKLQLNDFERDDLVVIQG